MNTSNNALTEAVYYILLALVEPIHGYGIMQQTATLSNGRVRLSAGTLYGALASLLDKGWIEQLPEEGRKKGYIIHCRRSRRIGAGASAPDRACGERT